MEGVGAEISQKIKSAIKAKLMEIGAFVDDELPDYIMVMVANKRTKAQMNDDLSLFLGSNTHHFTSWLHSVLEQLKQVTLISQSAKGPKEPSKRKSSTNGDSESEREWRKKRKGSRDIMDPQSSSLQTADITDRIKQELISEFSKESGVTVESTSGASVQNKRPLESSLTESKKVAQHDSKISEVDLKESSEVDSESSKKEDAAVPVKKTKHCSEVSGRPAVEKEPVITKEIVKNGGKDDTKDREDSMSLELSSDENEYINIKNDDIFLSGDEEVSVHRLSGGKSVLSNIINPKSSDHRSPRGPYDSKESRLKWGKSTDKSKPTPSLSDERKSRSLHRSRDRDVTSSRDKDASLNRDRDVLSSGDADRSSSKLGFNCEKKVMDAREVLNWKRSIKQSSVTEDEKSDNKSSRSKSIFDRLSNRKTTERTRERSSEQSEGTSKERSRSRNEPGRMTSTKTNVNILEDRMNREKRTSDTRSSVAQSKRQVISISQIAESERELLRSAQKVAAVKPQVSSQVLSRSHSSQTSKSQSHTSSRNHLKPRRKEKLVENRLSSRVIAKEPEPESDVEEITADVPSVVKVTPRPVIPTSKAAPRNLILKAVAEAEKSVQSSPVRSEKLRSKERDRKAPKPKEKFSKNISPACISITLPNDRMGIHKDGSASETWIDESEEEDPSPGGKPSLEVFKIYQSSRGEGRLLNKRSPSPVNRKTPTVNSKHSEDEYSGDGDSIEFNISENSLPDEELDYEPKKEPSFIVTLNNLDPAIKARAESEESKAVNRVKPQRIFVNSEKLDDSSNESVIPISNKTVSPVIISVSPSSPESNDESSLKKSSSPVTNKTTVITTAPVQVTNKVAEICKYWPHCLAGDKCPFVHITTSCVNFPNCKFGTRCMYTHPKCKFLNACVRKNCPYSHPVSSLTPSTPTLSGQTCKFFPQCTKIGCPYFHPKPCKFGANCMTKDCIFAHVNSPSGNKFKWSKSSSVQPLSIFL